MKKFFSIFLISVYFIFANAGFALADNLYFVKNSNPDNIKSSIVSILQDRNFVIKKQDPYYAISTKDNEDYVLIILQKSSNNYFYYIDTNNSNSVNKYILKAIKNSNATYEESTNVQYLSLFKNQAEKIISNAENIYTFDQITLQTPIPQQLQPKQDNSALRGSIIQVAKGSVIKTYLETPINTSNAEVGDEVRAVLSENWVYNGQTIAPQGSLLTGKLSKARHASIGSRNGRVVFDFNTLTTPDGKTYSISTDEIDFTVTNEGKWSKAAGSLVAGALAGAAIGLLIGLCSKDTSTWKSTAISAGAGLATGAITVAAEKGIDAEIPIYTQLDVVLLQPFSIVASY